MHILVVSPHYYPENFSVTDICEELVKRGHKVTVITDQPCYGKDRIYAGYEKIREETINGVHVYRAHTIPRKKGRISLIVNYLSFEINSKKIARHLKERCDIVYSFCLSPLTAVCAGNLYANKHHIEHVHHALDVWPAAIVGVGATKQNSLEYRYFYKLSRNIYKKMNEILVASPSFSNYFNDVLKLRNLPVKFIPQPCKPISQPLKPFIFTKKFNFVYAGNIGSVQMVEEMVTACSLLKEKYDFSFHILGSGSRLDNVLDLIKRNNLSNVVFYDGVVPNEHVSDFYFNSTALVLGLKDDGSLVGQTIPNKLVVYLSSGKPIVASICGTGLSVLQQTTGAICVNQTAEGFAFGFEKIMLSSDDARQKMGKDNLALYQRNFSFDSISSQIIQELTANGPMENKQ
jgi:glycosyltransferase involved in cell wall biosynthesis